MKLVAVKNIYKNIRGSKKVKILTKGKPYSIFESHYGNKFIVINDLLDAQYFDKSNFINIFEDRNNKLEELGI